MVAAGVSDDEPWTEASLRMRSHGIRDFSLFEENKENRFHRDMVFLPVSL